MHFSVYLHTDTAGRIIRQYERKHLEWPLQFLSPKRHKEET
jgi:hypothetical protein